MVIYQCCRVTIITALRIAALHRVSASDFTYDQGYLGLLSTIGGILGLIVCCAVTISWRMQDLFRYIRFRMRLFNRDKIDQFSNYKEPNSLWDEGKLYVRLMTSHNNLILAKMLEDAHHLTWSQRYPVVSTFSYRLDLPLVSLYRGPTSGLSGVQIWVQIVWKSHGRGILTGLKTWRAVQLIINPSYDWAPEIEQGQVEQTICS